MPRRWIALAIAVLTSACAPLTLDDLYYIWQHTDDQAIKDQFAIEIAQKIRERESDRVVAIPVAVAVTNADVAPAEDSGAPANPADVARIEEKLAIRELARSMFDTAHERALTAMRGVTSYRVAVDTCRSSAEEKALADAKAAGLSDPDPAALHGMTRHETDSCIRRINADVAPIVDELRDEILAEELDAMAEQAMRGMLQAETDANAETWSI